jgi:PAS domain S-box-containing protein
MGRQPGGPAHSPFAIEGVSAAVLAAALWRTGTDAIAVSERGSGRFVAVSDSYCALTGYSRAELIGRTSVELGMFPTPIARADALGPVDRGSQAFRELDLRRKDGAVRVLQFSAQLLAGDELMLTITRDVTARRELEARLVASEQRFRAAVGSMLDVFFILSPVRDGEAIVDFRYTYANDAHCAVLGLPRDEIVGRRIGEMFPAFVGSDRFGAFRHAVLTGEPARYGDAGTEPAWAGSRLDGRVIEINAVPVGEELVVSGRDVTERRTAEAQLRLHAQLLDLAHDAVIVREPAESRVTFWKREAHAVYGYQADEAVGRVIHDLLATQFPQSRESVDRALARDGYWVGELCHRRKDGAVIVVSSRQALQRDPDGRPIAVIELNSDISERHAAERRVSQLNADLDRRAAELEAGNGELARWSRALEQLAGGVAHEFNNKFPGPLPAMRAS